jgi:transposase InsO family protein
MCELLKVSAASYYRHWQASAPQQEETSVRDAVQRVAVANRHYGYRRVTAQLRHEGVMVNHKRVRRLMVEDNLLCLRHRPFVPRTTQSDHAWPVVANLVRKLQPTAPDQIWVADITYIRLDDGFVYLAVVLDAFSRKVVGWAIADHLRAELAVLALLRALRARRPARGLIHHSDRGTQYACTDYRSLLERYGLRASMSSTGNPYDNAKAESFMATLKREQIDGRPYRDLAQARTDIGNFIDTVYNRRRLHSALGYRSPEQFEAWHQAILNPGEGGAARADGFAPPSPEQPIETTNREATMQRFSP